MSKEHLCHSCPKAEDGSCDAYEQLTAIVDEYWDEIAIKFLVNHCEIYDDLLAKKEEEKK